MERIYPPTGTLDIRYAKAELQRRDLGVHSHFEPAQRQQRRVTYLRIPFPGRRAS